MGSHRNRPKETKRRLDEQAGSPRIGCLHPHKIAFSSRAAAKRARKRFDWAEGKLSAYLCPCGNWHLGRLPSKVKAGEHPRWRRA